VAEPAFDVLGGLIAIVGEDAFDVVTTQIRPDPLGRSPILALTELRECRAGNADIPLATALGCCCGTGRASDLGCVLGIEPGERTLGALELAGLAETDPADLSLVLGARGGERMDLEGVLWKALNTSISTARVDKLLINCYW
jgi:hypothetical protein